LGAGSWRLLASDTWTRNGPKTVDVALRGGRAHGGRCGGTPPATQAQWQGGEQLNFRWRHFPRGCRCRSTSEGNRRVIASEPAFAAAYATWSTCRRIRYLDLCRACRAIRCSTRWLTRAAAGYPSKTTGGKLPVVALWASTAVRGRTSQRPSSEHDAGRETEVETRGAISNAWCKDLIEARLMRYVDTS
jgi:hypothetical protein